MTTNRKRPAGNGASSRTTTGCSQYIEGLRHRRIATQRIPELACGHVDPWTPACRNESTDRCIDGYRDAAQHLLAHGLTPAPNIAAMRDMWKRGGADQLLAVQIANLWEVSA